MLTPKTNPNFRAFTIKVNKMQPWNPVAAFPYNDSTPKSKSMSCEYIDVIDVGRVVELENELEFFMKASTRVVEAGVKLEEAEIKLLVMQSEKDDLKSQLKSLAVAKDIEVGSKYIDDWCREKERADKAEIKCKKVQSDYDLCITDRAQIYHRMQKAEGILANHKLYEDYEHEIKVLKSRYKAMGKVLNKHHSWHHDIGTVIMGQGESKFEIDLSDAYSDSSLCDDTMEALAHGKNI